MIDRMTHISLEGLDAAQVAYQQHIGLDAQPDLSLLQAIVTTYARVEQKERETASPQLPKSQFKLGTRPLHELSHVELLEAVSDIWEQKNKAINTVEAERDGLKKLLSSSLPVHSLWRTFADNVTLMSYIALLAYMAGGHHG
jgi:hypothetical protein